MKYHVRTLLEATRLSSIALVAAASILAGCDSNLDYHSVVPARAPAHETTSSGQTDVDRAQHLVDENGVPFLEIDGSGKQRHPAWIALYALAYADREIYDSRLAGSKSDEKFQATLGWLEQNLQQDSSGQWVWQYEFDSTYNDISIKAPWSSAFAQAVGIQAFVVAYERSGDSRYLKLARKAAQALFTPLAEGGFLFEAYGDVWFEEIPVPIDNPGHILNGHMRVLLALSDLHKASNDGEIATWLKRGTDTLYRWLPKFDTGYWLRYDLNPRKAELLFRLANPYGYPNHTLAVDKITLRDPLSKAEVTVNVGDAGDSEGPVRIAGTHWGQPEQLAGRTIRRLVPAALDEKPDEMRPPHTYFYLTLPGEWQNNQRDQWYELVVEYYDDAAANITVQQRSVAPGRTFRDMRDGDLHLTGEGHWRKWTVPVRPSDLGYWVGNSYGEKHHAYLKSLSTRDERFLPWSAAAKGYLAFVENIDQGKQVTPSANIELPKQTPLLPIYSLDPNGVIMMHIGTDEEGRGSNQRGRSDEDPGHAVYSPYLIGEQLISGPQMPGAASFMKKDPNLILREPALKWLLDENNHISIDNAAIYTYPFDNAYNDIASNAPWPSAFGQAYVLKSLAYAYQEKIGNDIQVIKAIKKTGNAFSVHLSKGGIVHTDRSRKVWYEEVPNASHVLNAHLVSIPEIAEASRITDDAELASLSNKGIYSLKEQLHLFDTGYWLRYDQNPKKELLLQLDWLDGEKSPLIDEVLLQNPQTGHYVRLDIGSPEDSKGSAQMAGAEWKGEQTVDGRSVRPFSNGYQVRPEAVPGGARHNVFFRLPLPDREFEDAFDVPEHRLVIRYKDVSKGTFAFKIQVIHEGNHLVFAPLRGGIWNLQGDQQWKEDVFTIRPQDMGWYKGPDYQKYEVEQLQRIANLTNDWFFYQYADRHRYFFELQKKGVSAIREQRAAVDTQPISLSVIDAGETYPGHGFDNALDGDPNDDYTAGVEGSDGYVVLELDREASLSAIRLHWESSENRATQVNVREVLTDGTLGSSLMEGDPGPGQAATLPLLPNDRVKRLRIDFGDFVGQPRILLRQIEAISTAPDASPSPIEQSHVKSSEQFLGGNDPNNPLYVFRTPVTWEIKRLSDQLANGLSTNHAKILRFMDYISQFKVGIDGDGTPDATIQTRTGACGTFTGTLLALAASQGMPGRYINLMNYPQNMGHTVAEIFHDGHWHLYDPTYNGWYVDRNDPSARPLPFDRIKHLYETAPDQVKFISMTYRFGRDEFSGENIFTRANPIGVIGPSNPFVFPLNIDIKNNPIIRKEDIGVKNQGASYIGAAGVNHNHDWTVSSLTPGQQYVFNITPSGLGGDIFPVDRSFRIHVDIKGGQLLSSELVSADFSVPSPPLGIRFTADAEKVSLRIRHPYKGPDFRYMSIEQYEIKILDKD